MTNINFIKNLPFAQLQLGRFTVYTAKPFRLDVSGIIEYTRHPGR